VSIGLGTRERGQIALEGPQILELGTAGFAGIQMRLAVAQSIGHEPAAGISFQILLGQMPG
jgi:hypothetical protein